MVELKTLREIMGDYPEIQFGVEFVIINEMRTEIIKWIKQYRADGYHELRTFHFSEIVISIPAMIQRDGMIEWCKVFFGITEEELK